MQMLTIFDIFSGYKRTCIYIYIFGVLTLVFNALRDPQLFRYESIFRVLFSVKIKERFISFVILLLKKSFRKYSFLIIGLF